ncbi:hypothetical protein T552_01276 [Pneumocystis carinii B80]|uniref:Nucleotide exchange factor SIL1 n=1 Tax=Pneumocystis carinii (strain B80) TaxID=1408658 RepID=A0A0W4ZLS4_PNEC8|nr:hypothetical protein T552_01276 [Pneumocystis carinii B80]KTW29321.1 hypothetical protein T552_01276 [Pneumocystis carinii B80]
MKWKKYLLLTLILRDVYGNKQRKMICHAKKECYPEVFEATHVFQVVHEDQILPPGLHIRLDFSTGIKEAKIIDEDENDKKNVILVYKDGHIESGNVAKESPIFSNIPDIKPNLKISQAEHEEFSMALKFLVSDKYNESMEQLVNVLSVLEELSHEFEFGVKICKSRVAVERLIELLESSESIFIKKLAITVLGSSLQNNPQALVYISDMKLTKVLLNRLQYENDDGIKIKVLYTLSSIVKSSNGMNEFYMTQGDKILYDIFKKTKNPSLISKCASFIEDNYFQDQNYSNDNFKTTFLSFSMYIDSVIKHWCEGFQSVLFENELDADSKEKILSVLSILKKKHYSICKPVSGFLEFLDHETTLVYEKGHPYIGLLESIRHLFQTSDEEDRA